MNYPSKVLEKAVDEMSNLPGIGKRTALRLVLHMLNRPKSQTVALSEALSHLMEDVKYCQHCHTISDQDVCEICNNPSRDELLMAGILGGVQA